MPYIDTTVGAFEVDQDTFDRYQLSVAAMNDNAPAPAAPAPRRNRAKFNSETAALQENARRQYARATPKKKAPVAATKTQPAPGTNTGFNGSAVIGNGTASGSGAFTADDLMALLTNRSSAINTSGLTLGQLQVLRNRTTNPMDPTNPSSNDYVTINRALAEFMKADPDVVRQWQTDLADAGFFGLNSKGTKVDHPYEPGVPDDKTTKAFSDFLEFSMRRGGFANPGAQNPAPTKDGTSAFGTSTERQGGTGSTWQELLDQRKAAVVEEIQTNVAEGSGGGGGGLQMPDPVQIKAVANQIARMLQGSKLTPEQENEIVNTVNGGVVKADAANQNYDVESNIASWLRQAQPTQTAAHDLENIYSTMTDVMGSMGKTAARGGTMAGVTTT